MLVIRNDLKRSLNALGGVSGNGFLTIVQRPWVWNSSQQWYSATILAAKTLTVKLALFVLRPCTSCSCSLSDLEKFTLFNIYHHSHSAYVRRIVAGSRTLGKCPESSGYFQ